MLGSLCTACLVCLAIDIPRGGIFLYLKKMIKQHSNHVVASSSSWNRGNLCIFRIKKKPRNYKLMTLMVNSLL